VILLVLEFASAGDRAFFPARTEIVFARPVEVKGELRLPEGTGPCTLHFQWNDPALGWRAWRIGLPSGAEPVDRVLVPAHDQLLWEPTWCATCAELMAEEGPAPLPGEWRIADGDGNVVTAFTGPYAIDARELARRLDRLDDWRRGRKDPACTPTKDHECWTALELWLYVAEWQEASCGGRASE
jgi:hypothetical protein